MSVSTPGPTLINPPVPDRLPERSDVPARGVDRGVAADSGQGHGQGGGKGSVGLERSAAEIEGGGAGALAESSEGQQAAVEIVGSRRTEVLGKHETADRMGSARLREAAGPGVADVFTRRGKLAAVKFIRSAAASVVSDDTAWKTPNWSRPTA